jgi:hypothetical protein
VVTVHGVTDRARLHERVPTLCFSVAGVDATAVAAGWRHATSASERPLFSPRLMARLGL